MIITTADLNAFTGNYEDSEEASAMKTLFIESAQSVVADFLGYDPERHTIVEILSTREGRKLSLSGRNCTVTAFALDGALVPSASYRVGDDFISLKNGSFRNGYENAEVTYSIGWDAQTMPSAIKSAILRIAALKLMESNGNIGLTGKSYSDNSRSFLNYTNYNKYLTDLWSLRVVRF